MSIINCAPERMNLSFSGCGFLCVYHAGVAAAIKEFAPYLTRNKISGASAGAIVAACLVTDVCLSQATSTILKIVSNARSRSYGPLHPEFDLLGLVRVEMAQKLPPDAYKRCTGRLQISLTRWGDSANEMISEFRSNQELIDAIICSCFIPLYCGNTPPTFRGVQYMDGGFTNNQPLYDEYTVTVSPFSGESDICPVDWDSASLFGFAFSRTSIRLTTRNLSRIAACLMPPCADDCSRICLQGFEDTLRFLSRTIAPCIRCLTIQKNIYSETEDVSMPSEAKQMPFIKTQFSKVARTALLRRRLVSECDFCGDGENIYSATARELFPPILKKAFDEAFAAEESVFNHVFSFRLIRYTRTAFGIGMLPFDLFIIIAKKFTSWLAEVVLPVWLVAKLQSVIDFVVAEIEHQKSRLSQFSCLLPAPKVTRSMDQLVEFSEDKRKDIAFIREIDRRKKAMRKSAIRIVTPTDTESSLVNDVANEDSLQHVIEYTKSHDTMYEFHYLDENNQVRSFEIFNIADPLKRHDCHSHAEDAPSSSQSTSMVEQKEQMNEQNEHLEEEAGSSKSVVEGQINTAKSPSLSRITKAETTEETSRGKTAGSVHSASSDSECNGADKS